MFSIHSYYKQIRSLGKVKAISKTVPIIQVPLLAQPESTPLSGGLRALVQIEGREYELIVHETDVHEEWDNNYLHFEVLKQEETYRIIRAPGQVQGRYNNYFRIS
jgi:hypothetical protein